MPDSVDSVDMIISIGSHLSDWEHVMEDEVLVGENKDIVIVDDTIHCS